MTTHTFKGCKFHLWQGYDGTWNWQGSEWPCNRLYSGNADTKAKAIEQAQRKISSLCKNPPVKIAE